MLLGKLSGIALAVVAVLMPLFIGCASTEEVPDPRRQMTGEERRLYDKFKRQDTAGLKLRHHQLTEAIGSGGFSVKVGPPIAMMMMGDKREDRIREKEEIEREMLRRWRSGDKEAYLPTFGDYAPYDPTNRHEIKIIQRKE